MSWYKKSKFEYGNMMIFAQNNINNWQDVDSSFITEIGHDEQNDVLGVRMKSGKEYHYFGVPLDVYNQFIAAGSKGAFFVDNIKENYKFRLI